MNDEVNELVFSIGVLMEVVRCVYESAIKNGFTKKESLELAKHYMSVTLPKPNAPGETTGGAG